MNDDSGRMPGTLLRKVLERVLSWRLLEGVVFPALADLQHEAALVRTKPVWRRVFVLTRGYLAVWATLALCLASWPARSLREDWLGRDAAGPRLLGALAPRAGLLALVLTMLLVAQRPTRVLFTLTGDPWILLLVLPSAITVTVPVAFLLGLVLALGRLGARSTPLSAARWLGPAAGLSIACGLFTFGLFAWVTPQTNQLHRARVVSWLTSDWLRTTDAGLVRGPGFVRAPAIGGMPIKKGSREFTLGELQTRIREGRKDGTSTLSLEVEWHKKWAIPAACLLFGPLAIGLHGLWKRPRPMLSFALAFTATFLLYVALRIGEQAALAGDFGPLPAIWAGDGLLALVTAWLIARLPRLPGDAIPG